MVISLCNPEGNINLTPHISLYHRLFSNHVEELPHMKRTYWISSAFCAAILALSQIPTAQAQNTNPTATTGANGEVPAPDLHPTPPLTFPPSSACAFHGKPDCENKIKADTAENKKYGNTGVKGGAPATSQSGSYAGGSTPTISPLGGLSSGESAPLGPSSSPTPTVTTNPNSIGNPTAGTPNPSGTGSGASGGSVGGSVPAGGGSSSSSGGL
jgi:hypothetical protein